MTRPSCVWNIAFATSASGRRELERDELPRGEAAEAFLEELLELLPKLKKPESLSFAGRLSGFFTMSIYVIKRRFARRCIFPYLPFSVRPFSAFTRGSIRESVAGSASAC